MTSMTKVFISYRRDDSRKDAGRIYDSLVKAFDRQSIFKDVDSIPLGKDFRGVLREAVAKCDVLIAIIGINWLDTRDNDGNRRLDNPDDFVRIEIESALQRGITVIPVLVDNARMPNADELPSTLQDLAFRNAINVRDDPDFHRDVKRLIEGIQDKIPSNEDKPQEIASPSTPWRKKPEYIVPIVAAIIVGLFGLWQGVFANPPSPTPQPTTVAQTETETPTGTSTLTTTATNTLRPTSTSHPTTTNTPRLTSTPDPVQIASTPVAENPDWIPIEREFDSVAMVLVPVGCFMMGSEDGDPDEQDVHEICFDTPYWIDKYEVTNSDFDRLGGEAGRNSFWDDENHPRESITWFEAKAFCELRNGRLPTEAEWEYAARGPSNLTYPWGNEFIPSNVAYAANTSNRPEPVGSKPGGTSWVGAMDMSGNVWEWVLSRYQAYPYAHDRLDDLLGSNDLRARVNRGGSWGSGYHSVRTSYRRRNPPNEQYNILGFRCLIESGSVSSD